MDKAQIKSISLTILFFIVLSLLIYAISTSLTSPENQFVDDDGFLDLRGRCFPSNMNGTTSWNITNGTLYAKIGSGDWKANKTLQAVNPTANVTYLFNFTNYINTTADNVDVIWNIECNEQMELGTTINRAFTDNRTVQVRYASPVITITSPEDNALDIDGKDMNFTGYANSIDVTWNLTKVEFYTNITGTWRVNETYEFREVVGQTIFFNFSNITRSLPDSSRIIWGIGVTQVRNISAGINWSLNKTSFSVNRTLLIEYPPKIGLNSPTNGSWQKEANSVLNFTVNSTFMSGTLHQCRLYTNETGTWTIKVGPFSVTNGTFKSIDYQFPNGLSDVQWGVFCFEQTDSRIANASLNNTIRIDRTNPVPTLSLINLSSPVNNSFFNSGRLIVNYSLSDSYPNTCNLYANSTLNSTNEGSLSTGAHIFNASEGVYVLSLGCNDTAGNFVNQSATYLITIDTTIPTYSGIGNVSVSGSAHQRLFNITLSELSNLTIYYGTTTSAESSAGNNTFQLKQNLTISNFAQNTVYFFNLSACDRAGNCNRSQLSYGSFNFTFPYKLLTGWSYYGVYDAWINFSRILNETESEFVYYWNHTAQSWVSAQAGASANMGFEVGTDRGERSAGGRHVIALYESINSTWELRNTSSATSYDYNLTAGDNFVKLIRLYTFGNFSVTFLNTSFQGAAASIGGYSFNVESSLTPGNYSLGARVGGLPYNMTDFYFSAYNNTAGTWQPYYVYNSTIENGTVLNPRIAGDYTNIEIMWIFSRFNLTKNETNIIGNWSY